jgi:predicted alpha/beta hydrolase
LHGAIENGRIFYSESGKGFAPWLATQGFDVYVANLRGRGGSTPPISGESRWGQTEAITEDIPSLCRMLADRKPGQKQHWIAHSWGGVLMLSTLARFPELLEHVQTIVLFGTKRSVRVWNPQRLLRIDLIWHLAGSLAVRKYGYLPARRLGWGSDDESALSHAESRAWVKPSPWIDPRDSFDYGSAIRKLKLPPILSITGANDRSLGHPDDALRFIEEIGSGLFRVIGKKQGNLHDYDHISLLTHPDAREDHFRMVLGWMKG